MKKLTPEEQQKAKQLEKEIIDIEKAIDKKLKENRLEIYNVGKVHKTQIAFHKSDKRKKAMFGGNRTGKTVGGAVEAVSHAIGYSRFRKIKPSSGWVVSLTNEVQRDVAQKEILKWLPKKEIKNYVIRHGRKDDPENSIIDKIILKNGCTIGFKTCEQGRESFQGTSQGWIWFDEEPPEEIYKECLMRIMDTRGYMWFTMTPLKGLTFVYNLIYLNEADDPNVEYWMMEWEDNPWLLQEEIDEMIRNMSEEEREARQYGKFTSLCGFAFPELKKEIHIREIEPIPEYCKKYVALDYGLDALAAGWFWIDKFGYARLYKILYKKNLIISEAAKEILKYNGTDNIEHYYAPPDLWARRNDTGKSAFDIFRENGIVLIKSSNDRESGWMNVHEWLRPFETRDEQTGELIKKARLTFDEGLDPYFWKCMTNIQKSDKKPNDVATTPHELTHLPDMVRYFCVKRKSPSTEPQPKQPDQFGLYQEESEGFGEITEDYVNYGI